MAPAVAAGAWPGGRRRRRRPATVGRGRPGMAAELPCLVPLRACADAISSGGKSPLTRP